VGLFIIGMLVWGMAIGWVGQMILGQARKASDRNWLQALIAGAAGSFVGGAIGSILMGEGFQLKISGIIGSVLGAIIVIVIWDAISARRSK
jgi:uncharacterized membrane protein YeaQ/YmgE (transglycosylase-associated protein family)